MILVLACAGTAHAGDPPSHVKPFLDGDEDVYTVTGAFGAKDTTIVMWWNIMGRGSYDGFALVPDAKAKHGQRKLALPRLPSDITDGDIKTALVANLDKDADDELVVQLKVTKSVGGPSPHSYTATAYAVIDWDGKKLVRVTALEKKLEAKMDARDDGFKTDPLKDGDLRAALGLAKKP